MIDFLESSLVEIVGLLKFVLEAISVLCILLGVLASTRLFFSHFRRNRSIAFSELRLSFGNWLALALEFQLGSDILATTISPSFQALIQLGSIAVIRTFLNYFLQRELEAESALQKKKEENN